MAFFMMEYLHTQSLPVPHRVSLHLSNVNCLAAKKTLCCQAARRCSVLRRQFTASHVPFTVTVNG
jgi:hypothetical protein